MATRADEQFDFDLSEDQRVARNFLTAECPPALARDTATNGDGVPRALYSDTQPESVEAANLA